MKKKLSKIMLKTTPVIKLFFESFTSWVDSNSDGQGMLQNKQRHYHLHHYITLTKIELNRRRGKVGLYFKLLPIFDPFFSGNVVLHLI